MANAERETWIQQLKRFIIVGIGSDAYFDVRSQDHNRDHADTSNEEFSRTVHCLDCLEMLLKDEGGINTVLKLLVEYKDKVLYYDPLLLILAKCATSKDKKICQAAYDKVNLICNIPYKFFRFIKFTHNLIIDQRKTSPPSPQEKKRKKKRKVENISDSVGGLHITEKGASENFDESILSPAKRRKRIAKQEEKLNNKKKIHDDDRKSLGWGRMRRREIAKFYMDENKSPCRLLYLCSKYKKRCDWSHREALKYSHPDDNKISSDRKLVIDYCLHGYDENRSKDLGPVVTQETSKVIVYMKILDEVSKLNPSVDNDKNRLLQILQEYCIRDENVESLYQSINVCQIGDDFYKKEPFHLVREHIPTGFLKFKEVWEVLLKDMPVTAMLRNLGKMASLKMFHDNEGNLENIKRVTDVLNSPAMFSGKIHPVKILTALKVYSKGRSEKGKLKWKIQDGSRIMAALNQAFIKSLKSVELRKLFSTNKSYLICLDISDSMFSKDSKETLTPADISIAMTMATRHFENDVKTIGFIGDSFNSVDLDERLNDADNGESIEKAFQSIKRIHQETSPEGALDLLNPILYAENMNPQPDCIIIYTDGNGNNSSTVSRYLDEFNRGRTMKLVLCSLNEEIPVSCSDNLLKIVGFDNTVPSVIRNFVNS